MTRCEYAQCRRTGCVWVWDRREKRLRLCCAEHAELIVMADWPEYDVNCPKCGCLFGVN